MQIWDSQVVHQTVEQVVHQVDPCGWSDICVSKNPRGGCFRPLLFLGVLGTPSLIFNHLTLHGTHNRAFKVGKLGVLFVKVKDARSTRSCSDPERDSFYVPGLKGTGLTPPRLPAGGRADDRDPGARAAPSG